MSSNQMAADSGDEGIVALNYCAHAIEDLKRLLAGTQPHFVQSKRAIGAVIELLQHSVKFILPNCGELLDVDSFSQAHLDLLRLPYPVTAFEIPWKTDRPIDILGGIKQVTASRRIALCWEPDATPAALRDAGLNTILERFPQGGAFVLPVSWIDEHSIWTIGLGGSFVPYDNTFTPMDETTRANGISHRSYDALKEAGLVGKKVQKFDSEPFIIQPEQFESGLPSLKRKAGPDIRSVRGLQLVSATPLADADKAFHVLLPEQNLSINGHEHDVINRDVGPLGLYRLQSGVEGWE